jgi:two-component system, NtrC family, sensor histidine kinase KinB
MPLSVKNKIRWGTVFLFVLTVASGVAGIYYIAKLRIDSKNILTANYESLEYAHRMQIALDSVLMGKPAYKDTIAYYLDLQQKNITEKGEGETTASLQNVFRHIRNGDLSQENAFREQVQNILAINMHAIQKKYLASENAAEQALTIIITIVAVILAIGFTFAVNFPSVLTEPIYKLTDAIQQISNKNYRHRIHIQSKDEFGQLAHSFNEMAGRLEYFENSNLAQMIFEKSRAEAVINSLKDASIGIDRSDTILFANQQALQLLALSAKDMVGYKVEEIAKRNDLFRFLMHDEGNTPFKVVIENRENYFVKELVKVEEDNSGSKVIVLKNITSFKELDVAKTNFIATVSHELKTPLAASDLSLKLLEDKRIGHLSAEQKELVQSLKKDNQRMLRILSELLNLSQVEAGKIQLNIQSVSIYQAIESSVKAIAGAAKEKELTIEQLLEPGLPLVTADPDKIVWVLNNFFTNAIKHSPKGSFISIEAKRLNNELIVFVKDRGKGIEENYLGRVFERYFQVPGTTDTKGTGIGLAICRELVEAMNGKIWVNSKVGEGSSFGFKLLIPQ